MRRLLFCPFAEASKCNTLRLTDTLASVPSAAMREDIRSAYAKWTAAFRERAGEHARRHGGDSLRERKRRH
jgi:hypothetical protein